MQLTPHFPWESSWTRGAETGQEQGPFLGVLALQTRRSCCDLTHGGGLANAVLCLQSSGADPLPARSEQSRGARRHFY